MSEPLSAQQIDLLHAWWRAANYLSVGQIYLQDNPLLETPLLLAHVKRDACSGTGAPPRA
jgi:xylulose-5-phosphate/fructose-6-phosphate phosphoketolase